MKKMLMAVMVFIAVSIFSTVAYAADTATNITLDGRARFTVSLQSNSLVFSNEPIDKTYDSIRIGLRNGYSSEIISTIAYNRGQGNGDTLNLNGLADGSYSLRVGYVTNGLTQYGDRYGFTIDINGGIASFKADNWYAENLKVTANERTDAYALDFYKQGTYATDPAYVKQANIITAGITDDYLKVKTIANWVRTNMNYGDTSTNELLFPGGPANTGLCDSFEVVTEELCQAAGFPAKYLEGSITNDQGAGHPWTEVYVDNRWVFIDTTYTEGRESWFDSPIAAWSVDHELYKDIPEALGNLIGEDRIAWNGSLYITDPSKFADKVLKEIKNYTIGGLVTSTYGYDAKDMYSDNKFTRHWNFATDKVDASHHFIYIKVSKTVVNTSTATYYTTGGTKVFEVIPAKYEDVGNFSEGLAAAQDPKSFKYGYIDKTGKMVIAQKFTHADDFSNGYARIAFGDRYGIIDKTGKIIIPAKYDNVDYWYGNLFQIYVGGKWGLIDKAGKVVVKPKYYDMSWPKDGFAGVGVGGQDNEKYGLIDITGKEIIPPKYDGLGPFHGGLAKVRVGRKFGIIDEKGKIVVPIKYYIPANYSNDWSFSDGLIMISASAEITSKCGFIDITGKVVVQPKYSEAYNFSEGLALVKVGDEPNEKWGYIDKTGKEVVPLKYSQVHGFSEGLAAVKVGDGPNQKWGFVDKTGKEVIPPMYSVAQNFSEGLAAVKAGDGTDQKWGFINKTGKEVIPSKYDGAGNFCEGLAAVNVGKVPDQICELIDTAGNVVATINYNDLHVGKFSDGYAMVKNYDGYGYIDKTGKVIEPPKYDYIGDSHEGLGNFSEGLAIVRIGFTYGYIDKTGKEVIPLKYSSAKDFSHGVARIEAGDNQKCGLIDKSGKEIIPPIYTCIGDTYGQINFSEGLTRVRNQDNKWGFINITGVK